MKLSFSIALGVLAVSVAAQAGKDKGGGVGFECQVPGQKKTRVYLADTYDVFKDIPLNTDAAIIPAAAQILDEIQPKKIYPNPYDPSEKVSLAWMVQHLDSVRPIQSAYGNEDYQQPLDPVGDDNIRPEDVPAGCKKVQIAVQWFPYRIATYDPYLRARMSKIEFEFLKLHEIFISIRNKPGVSTQSVRADVEFMAEALKDPRLTDRKILERLLHPEKLYFQKFTKKETAAARFLTAHCGPKTSALSGLRNQNCARAMVAYKNELASEMRDFNLPMLANVPTNLQCVALANDRYSFSGFVPEPHKGKDASFQIRRVWGAGRPNVPWNFESSDYAEENGVVFVPRAKAYPNDSTYVLKFDTKSLLSVVPSEGTSFTRLPVDKSSAFQQSPFKFVALFSRGKHGYSIELNEYNKFTNEFIGWAHFQKDLGGNMRYDTSGKVHCRSRSKLVWE